ncbi:hypothetical protein K491DRAFT_261389 [Lophiostoma macrostomum CBS 122681]|uniref:Uncharacterized protein n=1 Tax=Lophiostoma macrostomum CBS 122681 TaxID=1314788 RepID=A0A6A6SK14_9PLEO|nr:hypothetical protein K491DRAFT_261389 [Lophiostoma macrostomum CBS 122681]
MVAYISRLQWLRAGTGWTRAGSSNELPEPPEGLAKEGMGPWGKRAPALQAVSRPLSWGECAARVGAPRRPQQRGLEHRDTAPQRAPLGSFDTARFRGGEQPTVRPAWRDRPGRRFPRLLVLDTASLAARRPSDSEVRPSRPAAGRRRLEQQQTDRRERGRTRERPVGFAWSHAQRSSAGCVLLGSALPILPVRVWSSSRPLVASASGQPAHCAGTSHPSLTPRRLWHRESGLLE